MSTKKKIAIILSCCAIVVGAVLLAYNLISDQQQRQLEERQQQYAAEVTQYVNMIYKDFSALEDDMPRRIVLYNVLDDYQDEYKSGWFLSAELDALFSTVLGNMQNTFLLTYNDMVGGVAGEASETVSERREYVLNARANIDDMLKRFTVMDGNVGELSEDEIDAIREERTRLFSEFTDMQTAFSANTYLETSADAIISYIGSLENIRKAIDEDGVITGTPQSRTIFNEIDRLQDSYNRELETKDYDNILRRYDTTLNSMKTWLSDFYASLIGNISARQRADAYDTETIEGQIGDLLALKEKISSDGIFDDDLELYDDIDKLVEGYNKEIDDIAERIEREKNEESSGGSTGSGNSASGNSSGTSSADSSNISSFAAEVLRLTNIERANHDLHPLTGDNGLLTSSAIVRATEIITSFSHTRPDGRTCFTVYTDAGGKYNALGENIAYGFTTVEEVVKAWMDSPEHRENILRPDFTQLGVGVVRDSRGTLHWAQMFCG